MKVTEYIKNHITYLDGGMGTMLQKGVLMPGELPENLNITHPDIVTDIHLAYYNSGSNIINTNTFGANLLKFSKEKLDEIIKAAFANAQRARTESQGTREKYIALDIGPLGKLLKPLGDLDFEEAVGIFKATVEIGIKYNPDLIFIETMNDSYETKAALLAAKESCDLPIFVSNAYGEDGLLMTGANPKSMVALLEGMGADAIGVNCSLGPKELKPVVEEYLKYSSLPVLVKPNGGLPRIKDGETIYDVSSEEFAELMRDFIQKGARIAGGCCGTTPLYIEKLVERTCDFSPQPIAKKDLTLVSSYTHCVEFNRCPVLIGERINPTGKKKLKAALINNDNEYILDTAVAQMEKGAHVLDVNVGLPEINEAEKLKETVFEIQQVCDLPLQIDTANISAMEGALRIYNGKPMINSVNGKKELMEQVFPLAKKYGGVIVALTLDESGIPSTTEGRIKIAERILKEAANYGIDKKDIVFDPLCMTVSADPSSAKVTLECIREITNTLHCKTSLGVSNISFGLPKREIINSAFFTMALNQGLSAAIMNPNSSKMMQAYHSYLALSGLDEGFSEYIDFVNSLEEAPLLTGSGTKSPGDSDYGSPLKNAIIKGFKDKAADITAELLKKTEPMKIVTEEIMPALDVVGDSFEKGTIFLPGLLMSGEAASSAFEKIKEAAGDADEKTGSKCPFVIATVKGDIHDIGKNIVKLILENYGFMVYDLGKDVDPEVILQKVLEVNSPLLGLSALMTTTLPAMEETIKLVHEKAPGCKIVVGGAVLTPEYAQMINADHYGKDALSTVRYAEKIYEELK